MSTEIPDETELLQASIRGDTAAFEAIVKRYQSFICAITFSATGDVEKSEDLAQETFISAWKDLSQLSDLDKFRSWLTSIARNRVKDLFKSQRRDILSKAASIDQIEHVGVKDSEPIETAISKEQQVVVRQALQKIPEKYRDPLVLFYRQERSIRQVAEQLQLSEQAVKQRLSRGRNLLKEQVAAIVETTIGRTGPGKTFTSAVIATVSGMALKASGAAAAGIATGTPSAAAAIMSHITAKIITVAAVVAMGVGAIVIYSQIPEADQGPGLSPAPVIVRQQRQDQTEYDQNTEYVENQSRQEQGNNVRNPSAAAITIPTAEAVSEPPDLTDVNDHTIHFEDPNLEHSVCTSLGMLPPVSDVRILDLTLLGDKIEDHASNNSSYIDKPVIFYRRSANSRDFAPGIEGKNIYSLSGIERAVNVEVINLGAHQIQISDISPLSSLTNLKRLHLYFNQISDISALSEMTRLEELQLYVNQVSDITALAGLTNLTSLKLGRNQIEDVSPLSKLTKLTRLDLEKNQIKDISSLSELTELDDLHLTENEISDISGLLGMKVLRGLWLGGNKIKDISVISGLINISSLHLMNNQIVELPDLSRLERLKYLYLSGNDINDISVLSQLGRLVCLDISGNQVTDLSALSELPKFSSTSPEDLLFAEKFPLLAEKFSLPAQAPLPPAPKLTSLNISNNGVSDLSDLSTLTNLRTLEAAENDINDVSAIEPLVKLMSLDLSDNRITDVEPLAKLGKIDVLYLGGNQISDLAGIGGLTTLSRLHLEENAISDLSELSTLAKLGALELSYNQISDVSAISKLPKLRRLWLQSNQIDDISDLSTLTTLYTLNLGENRITDISAISGMKEVVHLYLDRNSISDIPVISELKNLIELDLSGNQIRDISALAELTKLKYLDLENNPLNKAATRIHIPKIIANNPGIDIRYKRRVALGPDTAPPRKPTTRINKNPNLNQIIIRH